MTNSKEYADLVTHLLFFKKLWDFVVLNILQHLKILIYVYVCPICVP